jgi:hypothetical protein
MNKAKALTLEGKTQLFWNISQAYNRQQGPLNGISTEKAIRHLGEIEEITNKQKIVAQQTTKLLDEIIGGPCEEHSTCGIVSVYWADGSGDDAA